MKQCPERKNGNTWAESSTYVLVAVRGMKYLQVQLDRKVRENSGVRVIAAKAVTTSKKIIPIDLPI